MRVDILDTTPEHIRELAISLRPEDRREIEAFGFPTNKALWRTFKDSIMRKTAIVDGKVAACWGVGGTPLGDEGRPWLMTSPAVELVSPLRFARIYQDEVHKMLNVFPKLVNYVDSQYTKAMRLLDIIGFRLRDPEPWGSKGGLFCRFEMGGESLEIRECTISEIENSVNFPYITEEYKESAIEGLPEPLAKAESYKDLERTGALHPIGAFKDGVLIGFILILVPIIPHYSIRIAVTESFFVLKEFRRTGAGLKLLREAEKYSRTVSSTGLLVSAPLGSDLAEVLPHVGYTETNRVFFRGL